PQLWLPKARPPFLSHWFVLRKLHSSNENKYESSRRNGGRALGNQRRRPCRPRNSGVGVQVWGVPQWPKTSSSSSLPRKRRRSTSSSAATTSSKLPSVTAAIFRRATTAWTRRL